MKFDLVVMPWLQAEFPSMAVSRLRPALRNAGVAGSDHYANLRWLQWMLNTFGIDGGRLYSEVVDGPTHLDMGSWIFARTYWSNTGDTSAFDTSALDTSALDPSALDPSALDPSALDTEYLDAVEHATSVPAEALAEVSDHVTEFCRQEAVRILDGHPDVVGMTTTFGQTYPSLALARSIKQLSPTTPIVFGGANCDGEMGAALLDAFADVDFTITGEGEHSIVALAAFLADRAGSAPSSVPGLSWRDAGTVRTSTAPSVPVDLDALPTPDHGAFFEQFESAQLAAMIPQPGVVVETSRGCWWGEKMHCTFCGLNGATMNYRSESGARAVDQIVTAVREHRAPNVVVVDNILDQAYFDDALPALAALDHDLSIFYEIRSDVTANDARALASAGIRFVQPGIESLGTQTLRLMRKSTTGSKQVQVLRDLHTEGITVAWNYLYGFPGEDWQRDYAPIVDQLPNLVHLAAPSTTRIGLQRFSPNFTDETFGFRPIDPPAFTPHIHRGLREDQVMNVVYRFSTPDRGCSADEVAPLHAAIAHWQDVHRLSSLRWRRTVAGIMIQDRRANRPAVDHVLDDVESTVHDLLQVPLTRATVHGSLGDRGHHVDRSRVDAIVEEFAVAGLVFVDGERVVALANEARRPVAPESGARRRRLAVAAT